MSQKIVCIIPARLNSSRFPRKILASIHEKPILQWVWQAANKAKQFSEIIFAIDSKEAEDLINSFGGKFIKTSPACQSGTDRLVELMSSGKVKADIWVNWQGDEPFITSKMIDELLCNSGNKNIDVWTLKKLIINKEEIFSPHFAKVVCDVNDNALYFSRSPIPFYRDEPPKNMYKHVGLYAYTNDALKKISKLEPCEIEDAEKLEQLRFLFNGLKIKVNTTTTEVIGIDRPEDILRAEIFIGKQI